MTLDGSQNDDSSCFAVAPTVLFGLGSALSTILYKAIVSMRAVIFYLSLIGVNFWQSHVVHSFALSSVLKIEKQRATTLYATQNGGESTLPRRANELIEALWGTGANDINRIASACSADVVWEDMRLKKPVQGKNAVYKLLTSQFPRGTTMSVDKVGDGSNSTGFTWTRECSGKLGLRGTTYVRLNDEGKIECVKELAEPLYKPGDMMLKLLQAATKNVPRPEKNPSYVEETPTSCTEIVDCIWNRAYPLDAPVDEAINSILLISCTKISTIHNQ